MRITQKIALTHPRPDATKDCLVFDDRMAGFGLRIRKHSPRVKESRVYVVHYRLGGKVRKYSLGDVFKLKNEDARARAQEIFAMVARGVDPVAARAKADAKASQLFRQAVDDYLVWAARKMKPKTLKAATASLKKQWGPEYNDLSVGDIDKAMVAKRRRELSKSVGPDRNGRRHGGPVASNRAASQLSAFFTWAIGEDMAAINPVIGTNRNPEKPRTRELKPDELVTLWREAGDDDHGKIVRLLMLTLQRRTQIGALAWSEVDKENRRLFWEGHRMKYDETQEIYLADPALEIINSIEPRYERQTEAQRLAGDPLVRRKFLFGTGKDGFTGWTRSQSELNARMNIPPWHRHDLRRTVDNIMGEKLGIAPHVIDELQHHRGDHKAGVKKVYRNNRYLNERRVALIAWADYLMDLVARSDGANVIPFDLPATA